MTTEIPVPQSETGIIEQDLTMNGKNILITGASRDIGESLALAFIREGANVQGVYREKSRRANSVQKKAEGLAGSLSFTQADITTQEGLDAISESVGDRELDVLILNASGPTRDVNVTAAQNLINMAIPRMKQGGTILLMQSVPGHFAGQLGNSDIQAEFYRPIADAKRDGEIALRKRIDELDELGIKVLVACPPVVADTSNMRIFKGIDKEAASKHDLISDALGLPREVSREDVAKKVVEMLENSGELPTGYTEFFNNTRDARSLLSKWYDEERIYVDTARRFVDTDSERAGNAHLIVSEKQSDRVGEPKKFLDGYKNDPRGILYGSFTPFPEHSQGHFKKESGLPLIYPGHKQIRTALEYAGHLTRMLPGLEHTKFRLQSAKGIEFIKPILSDGATEMRLYATDHLAKKDGAHAFKIAIHDDEGSILTKIGEIIIVPSDEDEDELYADQLIEGAAQAAGSIGLDFDPEKFPLFGAITDIQFPGRMPRKGEPVEYVVSVEPQGKRGFDKFTAAVNINTSDGNVVATARGIQATLFPKKMIDKFLK